MFKVVLPLESPDAEVTEVNTQVTTLEGYVCNREYFEPLGDFYFWFFDSKEEADKLAKDHANEWTRQSS